MTLTEESAVALKTRELCQAILDDPGYQALRKNIETFLANDDAKNQYQALSEKGEHLQHKQQQGLALTDDEVNEFEQSRQAFMDNPIARGFLDAQQAAHKLQESVSELVGKTFELGRVPSSDDLDSGGCGHGCGCHH